MQNAVLRHKTRCAQYLQYARIAVTDSVEDSIRMISRSKPFSRSEIANAIESQKKRTLPSSLDLYTFENDIQDMNNSMLNRKRERQQDKYLMIEWNENHNNKQ